MKMQSARIWLPKILVGDNEKKKDCMILILCEIGGPTTRTRAQNRYSLLFPYNGLIKNGINSRVHKIILLTLLVVKIIHFLS